MKYAQKTSAVSPIVATLVLIVVAVVGAVAVGTIMGTFSGDVSKKASTGDVVGSSQTEILTAGSTTVQPASEQLAKVYTKMNPGIKITVQGGASDAGVAATGAGTIDIGASSNIGKITAAQAAHPEWDLRGYQIGGSGVVWIANGVPSATMIKKSDLYKIYNGSTAWNGYSIGIQRSDGSGTEEAAAKWLTLNQTDTSGKKIAKQTSLDALTGGQSASGNAGVLALVKGTPNSIGFVDMGFAYDANGNPVDGITVLSLTDDLQGYGTTGLVYPTTSKANIQTALKDIFGTAQKAYSTSYPADPTDTASLSRGLFYMTKGEPSPVVKNFINFAQTPGACDAMHAAGVFCMADLA